MKIFVISGFLGAGKTTFIKEMIKATQRQFVIFENEFADVNIDSGILKNENNKDIEVWEMSNGCVCCSTQSDFAASLILIDNALNPDFLIVEPSGVAILSNVIKNIKKSEYERINMLNPLTIVDVSTYFKYKVKYRDIFLDQIKSTKYIQFSKINLVQSDELENVIKDIQTLNPEAIIYSDDYHNKDISYWDTFFEGNLSIKESDDVISEQEMQNMSFRNVECNSLGELIYFIDRILLGYFGNICRAKGTFKIKNDYAHFELVDSTYEIYFDRDIKENNIVVIGNTLKTERIENYINNRLKK